jgi:hypothetical protein
VFSSLNAYDDDDDVETISKNYCEGSTIANKNIIGWDDDYETTKATTTSNKIFQLSTRSIERLLCQPYHGRKPSIITEDDNDNDNNTTNNHIDNSNQDSTAKYSVMEVFARIKSQPELFHNDDNEVDTDDDAILSFTKPSRTTQREVGSTTTNDRTPTNSLWHRLSMLNIRKDNDWQVEKEDESKGIYNVQESFRISKTDQICMLHILYHRSDRILCLSAPEFGRFSKLAVILSVSIGCGYRRIALLHQRGDRIRSWSQWTYRSVVCYHEGRWRRRRGLSSSSRRRPDSQ